MTQLETRVEDDTLYVADGDGGWLEVGTFPDIFAVVGGETVDVQYGAKEAAFGQPWLDTDEDDVLTIDVRETLADMSFPPVFVARLADRSLGDGTGPDGVPERTTYFAESMERVWRSRGDVPDEENPFL